MVPKRYYVVKRIKRPRETIYRLNLGDDGLPLDENSFLGHKEEEEKPPFKESIWSKILSTITIIAFVAGIGLAMIPWQGIPLLPIIGDSISIKENMEQDLIESVVSIEVIAKKDNDIGVEEKEGTGFNINSSGVIVTNYHVLENATKVVVKFPDGQIFNGIDWQGNKDYDLAIINLSITSDNLSYVNINNKLPQKGEKITILGNPLGFKNIAVKGIVGEQMRISDHRGIVISLKADIYSGNSGSPVYNEKGEVIAVVFATLKKGEVEENEEIIGLAIPIGYLKSEIIEKI